VTLSFIDVNGDKKPDMIINFQGTHVVFINDQEGFRPLRPEERNPVERFLQRLVGHLSIPMGMCDAEQKSKEGV